MPKTLFVIAGATATGKTDFAIELALRLNTEIISADSRQVYREMSIGTAAPTYTDLQKVKHHLVRHRSIHDDYNAGMYEKEALQALDSLFHNNDSAVQVGGSGLYIDAVCKGFDTLPPSDPQIRLDLETQFEREGIQWLQNQLAQLDPEYFKESDIKNPRRLIRALEVIKISGKPYSAQRTRTFKPRNFEIRKYCLSLPRTLLHERIGQRVDRMVESGLIEEAQSLLPWRAKPALLTVGYQELFEYFDGKVSLMEAIENIKTNTRRYARRQETWFRKDSAYVWGDANAPEQMLDSILRQI